MAVLIINPADYDTRQALDKVVIACIRKQGADQCVVRGTRAALKEKHLNDLTTLYGVTCEIPQKDDQTGERLKKAKNK